MKPWILVGFAVAFAAAPAGAQALKIGTFHKTSVVVAYYRSPFWSDMLSEKRKELQTAKAANDAGRIKELEAWGGKEQERAEKQLAGEASIDNIIEALKPAFPEIARKAGVAAIAPDLPYADSRLQTVDVTSLLLDWLNADAQTRAMIAGLPK